MYYYLLLNKLLLFKCNLIEAQFDKFARIWMQHPMWLRGIIPGTVFNTTCKFDAYSAVLEETINFFFENDKVLCARVITKFRRQWQQKYINLI